MERPDGTDEPNSPHGEVNEAFELDTIETDPLAKCTLVY